MYVPVDISVAVVSTTTWMSSSRGFHTGFLAWGEGGRGRDTVCT